MNKPLIFNPLKYAFIIALGDPRGTSGKKTISAKIKEFGELEIKPNDIPYIELSVVFS
jgi:hypothetical protein